LSLPGLNPKNDSGEGTSPAPETGVTPPHKKRKEINRKKESNFLDMIVSIKIDEKQK
jgi:hypothetical protein